MARFEGETSNQLFEILEDWNTCLERSRAYQQEALPCNLPKPPAP